MILHKVLIFGSRKWTRDGPIRHELLKLRKTHDNNLLIIEGGAPGADRASKRIGHELNIHVAEIDALWKTRHRSAGPQRNQIMAALEPDEGIGFHEDFENSSGTKDMAKKLDRLGVPYKIKAPR